MISHATQNKNYVQQTVIFTLEVALRHRYRVVVSALRQNLKQNWLPTAS